MTIPSAGRILLILALGLKSLPILADDGSALSTPWRGLTFTRDDHVSMESEYLKISPRQIDVSFLFRNHSDKDVELTIAFPLPALTPHGSDDLPLPDKEANFHVWADGQEISTETSFQVLAYDGKTQHYTRDLTEAFAANGLNPRVSRPDDPLKREKLLRLGLLRQDDQEWGDWHFNLLYYWKQKFPAGKSVTIRHTYSPWIGGWHTLSGSGLPFFDGKIVLNKEPYCFDRSFMLALGKLIEHPYDSYRHVTTGTEEALFSDDRDGSYDRTQADLGFAELEYILKTGAGWNGPIGKFTLEIDKDRTELVSLCQPGGMRLKKQGNSFVGTLQNFTPTSDLKIIFLGGEAYSYVVDAHPDMAH